MVQLYLSYTALPPPLSQSLPPSHPQALGRGALYTRVSSGCIQTEAPPAEEQALGGLFQRMGPGKLISNDGYQVKLEALQVQSRKQTHLATLFPLPVGAAQKRWARLKAQ